MTSNVPDNAAVLSHCLWECETPPPSTFVTRDLLPSTSSGVFKLTEDEAQAILAALDGNNDCVLAAEETDALKRRRAKASKRRNRHRQRVKEEWQELRLQDKQLSMTLEMLKRARVGGVSQLNWQTMASYELEARLQAEGQQQRIRSAIKQRVDVMQTLQQVVDTELAKSDQVLPEWGVNDINLYDNFMFELMAVYAQTEAVLHICGLNGDVPSNTSFYKPIRRRDTALNSMYLESTSAFIIPSRYPDSADTMFNAMRLIHAQHPHRKLYETQENLLNTIAVKFGTVNHCEDEEVVSWNLVTVLHRFVETDRTVIVWRCLIEGKGDFAGTCLDETGWCVLRPTSSDSTDLRTCIHSVPVYRDATMVVDAVRVEAFATAVVRSSQQDSLKLAYLMDQLLLST